MPILEQTTAETAQQAPEHTHDEKGTELRIIGFLCNWCSYGGADTAGVGRMNQPTDLRIIKVPCSGRIDPLFILRAFFNGADGVLVSGCHPHDCHYSDGNFYARRRLEVLREYLPVLGIDPERFEYTWVSASEGQRWQQVVQNFTDRIHAMGALPLFQQATGEIAKRADDFEADFEKIHCIHARPVPVRPLHCNESAPLAELKTALKEALPDLDCILGWKQGYDALHSTPTFMRSPEDIDELIWGPLNVQNLAVYLPSLKGRKAGIVVKGCEARSVVELLQENLIARDEVRIFSMNCDGVIDMGLVEATLEKAGTFVEAGSGTNAFTSNARIINNIQTVSCEGTTICINCLPIQNAHESVALKFADVCAAKCLQCASSRPVLADKSIGEFDEAAPAAAAAMGTPIALAQIDAMSLAERATFWKKQMERCIRCYACRNACPMCVCRDHCVAESRDPHWLTQENSSTEKLFFQSIHALHLAGRCTGCGECQRACPVSIPILALRQQTGRAVKKLFEYAAGTDVNAVPPLMGFEVEETHLKEREWS